MIIADPATGLLHVVSEAEEPLVLAAIGKAPAKTEEPKGWKPEVGERYKFFSATGDVCQMDYFRKSWDEDCVASGNAFDPDDPTLEAYLVRHRLAAQRLDLAAYEIGMGVDEMDENRRGFRPCINSIGALASVSTPWYYSPYRFPTREKCDQFIARCEQDIYDWLSLPGEDSK